MERLEPRRLYTSTIQIQISGLVDSITAYDMDNLPLSLKSHGVTGTVTLTGNNLATQTVGDGFKLSGNVSAIDDITLIDSTAKSTIFVRANRNDGITLGSFESPDPMASICFSGINLTGTAQLIASPRLLFARANAATIDITQDIPTFNFKGYNFNDSTINIINPGGSLGLNLDLKTGLDTQFITSDFIKSLRLNSYTESTSDSAGLTAEGVGLFNVVGDYKADLTFNPALDLKYTIDDFNIGGTASGSWTVPGNSYSLDAHTFDSGFNGTFGSLGKLRVGTNFSGSLTAGTLDTGTVGNDLLGATLDFTNPYSPTSWNVGSLHVGSTIESSTIMSNGNLGAISTMYTYYGTIEAGIIPGFMYGQPITLSDYISNAFIKSFISDCPSHHYDHFIGSYVGAYDLWNVHLGNVQTDYGGIPFGLAGFSMDKVSVLINHRTLNFSMLDSAAGFDAGLQKYDLTPQSLGDFSLQFVM